MELDSLSKPLLREVHSQEAVRLFGEVSRRHSSLAPFTNPMTVIAFLNDRERDAAKQRSAVTRALVDEAQRKDSSLWSSMLVLAFGPMLKRYAHRTQRRHGLDDTESTSLVVECFMDVVDSLRLGIHGRYVVANLARMNARSITERLNQDLGAR